MALVISQVDRDEKRSIEKDNDVVLVESPLRGVSEVLNDKAKIKKAGDVDYAAAVKTGRIDPLTRSAFVLYACAAAAFLCSCGNGYDGSLMTGINGMPYYQNKFNQGTLDVSTGLIFSIYTVGQMAGSLFAGHICDRWGRRAGCAIIMIGSAIIASSEVKRQFVAGRFVLGFGIAIATIGAPTYTVEVAPPQWRGRLTSLYNTGWNGGAIPAAAITLGTSRMLSDWSWRIPLIIQAFPAMLVVLTIWFLPESPRWLMAHGRTEEAFEFLIKYHGNGDREHPIVQLQMREFTEGIRTDGSDKRWWDFKYVTLYSHKHTYPRAKQWWVFRALFVTSNARWRILMVFLMGFFGQMSGNGLGYFNLSIYESLGFGKQMQFNMNLISTCANALVAWIAVSLEDRMPRRKVLVAGTFACAVMLALNAAFSARWAAYTAGEQNLAIGDAGIAFYFLFGVVYAFTYTPLQSLYPAECLETTTRAKGVSFKIFIIGCTSFINLFCTPIAYGRIGWKYMLVFVGWDTFETAVWYFFCVETQVRAPSRLLTLMSDSPVHDRDARWRYAVDSPLARARGTLTDVPLSFAPSLAVRRGAQELDAIFSAPDPVGASKRKRRASTHASLNRRPVAVADAEEDTGAGANGSA
ncbi:sugar transporter [Heterobasidion irregulare TC 32-1]|uniref:Sugar transporter n=1 Tax=Heterobasidion irregulare (strain TC 32-1) TaxID=747525 RepID=W4JUC8_HETIT|nr:sugar transporter [Heterobasidion irregulare TC 32-1]ETW76486.1 sugar transporter [Heterobasidion irregulare TC 32-1]